MGCSSLPDLRKEQVQALLLADISLEQSRVNSSILAHTVACILLNLCAYHITVTYWFSSPVYTMVADMHL